MSSRETIRHIYIRMGQISLLLLFLLPISFYNYTLFYSLADIISIVVSFGIFAIIWNSRNFIVNKYFVFVGVASLFISILQALHLLSLKSFDIFGPMGQNLSDEFWLAARLLKSSSFFLAILVIGRSLKSVRLFYIYLLITVIFLVSVFWLPLSPVANIQSQLTPFFKKVVQSLIIFFEASAIIGLYFERKKFNSLVLKLLLISLFLSVTTEIILSSYLNSYEGSNALAYMLKIVSLCFLYVATVEMGLRKPYAILFKELKDAEKKSEGQVHRLEELSNDLNKFKIAVENTLDSVVITDNDNKIIFVNAATEVMSGYKKEEIMDSDPITWGGKMGARDYSNIWQLVRVNKNPFRGEINKKHKNGQTLVVDVQVYPIVNNEEIKFYVYIERDITKTKQIDLVKTEFISLASHQLRTPITSVALASELLLKSIGDTVNKKQKRYLQEIYDSTRRMTTLINNLLNVSRIDMDSFLIREELLDVIDNTNQIISELDSQISAKHLKLIKNQDKLSLIVLFDKGIFRIIVENLLSNAITYTPRGGVIKVNIQEDYKEVVISISDTGYGIPLSSRDKIFTKFFRADNARELNSSGNGLGLYIAREMAEKVGARIWFEVPEKGGTIFFVSIPVNKNKKII